MRMPLISYHGCPIYETRVCTSLDEITDIPLLDVFAQIGSNPCIPNISYWRGGGMWMRYLVVCCLWFFLFASYSYAQDYQVGNHVQLVERDFGIPGHPGPGDRKVTHRFPYRVAGSGKRTGQGLDRKKIYRPDYSQPIWKHPHHRPKPIQTVHGHQF